MSSTSSNVLSQLSVFAKIVEAGSFAEAARKLGMSTSAVSKSISRFESTYGLRLLHRSTHSLALTAEGESLLNRTRDVLNALDGLEDLLKMLASPQGAGPVRISGPTAFVRSCLLPSLPAILENSRHLSLDVRSRDTIDDLAASGIDLAIRSGSLEQVPGHYSQPLMTFSWMACASVSYLEQNGAPDSPDRLGDHKLIGFRNARTGKIDDWYFTSRKSHRKTIGIKYSPHCHLVFDDALSAWEAAKLGQGIIWAPEWLAVRDLRGGSVVEILADFRHAQGALSILRRQKRLPIERGGAVVAALKAASSDWKL